MSRYHITMKGGLGNQLYQLAQRVRLEAAGHTVTHDFKSSGEPRDYGLDWFRAPDRSPHPPDATRIFDYWGHRGVNLTPARDRMAEILQPDVPAGEWVDYAAEFRGRMVVFVRRTDHADPNKGRGSRVTSEAYYREVMAGRRDALIVTDDVPWVRENMAWAGEPASVNGQHPALQLWCASYADCFVQTSFPSSFGRWAEHIKDIHSADTR